jgi:predicted TIM-barrel enzyme
MISSTIDYRQSCRIPSDAYHPTGARSHVALSITDVLTVRAQRGGADHSRDDIHGAAGRDVGPAVLVAEPAEAQYVLDHTMGVAGLFGASSVEHLAAEVAITENMRRFGRITRTAGVAG